MQVFAIVRETVPQVSYQQARASLKAMILFFGLLLFIAIFGTLLCGLWYGHFTQRAIQLTGLETQAILEDKYLEDTAQGLQYWFTYRFTTLNDETYLSSIEVSEAIYTQYEQGTVLTLQYQANNPTLNSLDILNTDLKASLRSMLGLSILVIGIVIFLSISLLRSLSR